MLCVVGIVVILQFLKQLQSNFRNFQITTMSTTAFTLLLLYYGLDGFIFDHVCER